MEPLGQILKSYGDHTAISNDLDKIKTILQKNNTKFLSVRLKNSTLVIYVANNMEATELRYKKDQLLSVLKPQVKVDSISIFIRG